MNNESASPQQKFISPRHIGEQSGIVAGMQVADFGCGQGILRLLWQRSLERKGKVSAIDIQDSAPQFDEVKGAHRGIIEHRS